MTAMMPLACFRWLFPLWKQVVMCILLAVTISNLSIYFLSQKRYAARVEEDFLSHRAALSDLTQLLGARLPVAPPEPSGFDKERAALLSRFFAESPSIAQLTARDADGQIVWGRENPRFAAYLLRPGCILATDSPERPLTRVAGQPPNVHVIELSFTLGRAETLTLRGVYEFAAQEARYARIMHVTFYLTVFSVAAMVFLGLLLLIASVSRHFVAKQQQIEEYAVALEEARQHLRKTRKELYLSEKLASLGYLAAGIAHEIGNPLGAVSGYVELLRKGKLDEKKRADVLERVMVEVERMRRIIQELVTFSRPHSLRLERVDVNQTLRKMIAQFPPPRGKRVEIRLQCTDFPLFTDVDAHKLQSVFVNILQNGIDAIEDDGDIQISTSRRIRESAAMLGGSEVIAIQFSDTGSGIPESALPKIFDPFFTTKEPGKGMGLGLSLCHRIIESFHGEIDVESAPGKGTDVMVFLSPARKNETPDEGEKAV